MTRSGGVLLILGGLGLVLYVASPSRPTIPPPDDLAFQSLTLEQSGAPAAATGAAAGRTDAVLSTQARQASRRPADPPKATEPARDARAATSAPTVVSLSHQNRLAVNLADGSSSAARPSDGMQIAKALQRELKRVGCYEGEISGAWTPSTRRAMKALTDRVNASLPVDTPDLALLSLVQSQTNRVCGQPCPAGEAAADGGRCVPSAIAATAAAKGPAGDGDSRHAIIGVWSATAKDNALEPEGRMSLAGPAGDPPAGGLAAGEAAGPGSAASAGAGPEAYQAAIGGPAAARPPQRRFDARNFFKRLDTQSSN